MIPLHGHHSSLVPLVAIMIGCTVMAALGFLAAYFEKRSKKLKKKDRTRSGTKKPKKRK